MTRHHRRFRQLQPIFDEDRVTGGIGVGNTPSPTAADVFPAEVTCLVDVPLPAGIGGQTYLQLLQSQSATHYWPFQTQRNAGAAEPDVIDSINMTMTSGDCGLLSAGDGPLGGGVAATDRGIVFVLADTENMQNASVSVNTQQNFSWSGWRRCAALSGNGPTIIVIQQFSPTRYIFLLHRDDRGGLVIQLDSGSGAVFADPGSYQIGNNTWRHIAMCRQYNASAASDTWNLYLDGSSIMSMTSSAAGAGTTTGTATGIGIGGQVFNTANYYPGDLAHDALAIGTCWSAAQVLAQWNMRL